MQKRLIVGVVLVWFSLGMASEAHACSCVMMFLQSQPCSVYWNSEIVFAGTVTEVGPMLPIGGNTSLFSTRGRFNRFKVDAAFRGISGETVDTFDHGDTCDYYFKTGERYFVYASRDPKDGKIYVSSCSSTKPLDRAEDDLAFARGVTKGEPTPSIVGMVARETRARVDQYRKNTYPQGIRVTANGGERTAEAFTDQNGIFRFFGLPPGSYNVRALIPSELRRLYGDEVLKVQVSDGRCNGGQFVVTSLSSIEGRVLNLEGVPVKTRLNLVAVDASGAEIAAAEGSIESYSDDQGRYKFDYLAPGNYLVAMNDRNQPGTYDPPYARSYLPGVNSKQQATVISVVDGQQVKVGDFQLPAPLALKTIQGVAVLPDGSPAANALVRIEFTEREWTETFSADAQGHFTINVYDGFKYLIAAELRKEVQGVWRATHSPAAEIVGGQANGVTLVVSQPGFSMPRYVELKRKQKQP